MIVSACMFIWGFATSWAPYAALCLPIPRQLTKFPGASGSYHPNRRDITLSQENTPSVFTNPYPSGIRAALVDTPSDPPTIYSTAALGSEQPA